MGTVGRAQTLGGPLERPCLIPVECRLSITVEYSAMNKKIR